MPQKPLLVTILLSLILVFSGCVQTSHRAGNSPSDSSSAELSKSSAAGRGSQWEPDTKMTSPGDNSVAVQEESTDFIYSEPWALQDPMTEDLPAVEASGKKVQSFIDEALDYIQIARDFWENGELENALEALDQAYSLVLKVETFDNPGLLQQKEDLRLTISKRILEIYASRNLVVNGTHDEIPVEINRHVQAEIKRFTKGSEKTFFRQSYQRSGRYRPYIVAQLKAAGLPEELSWLPLIESGYKVRALSKARALGLWQFIPSTGYKFGLKRDMYIDERLDPEKATRAAIEYLTELHQMFGDWTTVLAAYNSGEGRVLRVIRDQNINYLDNFWDLYERLPLETARYVPRFLATLHIVNHLKKYGLDDVALHEPLDFETVTVSRRMHLKNVAKVLDLSEKQLRTLNPELRYGVLPPDNYDINLPPGYSAQMVAKLGEIPISTPPQRAFVYHRVRPGETLSTIAERYRTSVRSIQVANNIRRKNFIRAGQKLKIPQKGTRVYPARRRTRPPLTRPSIHVVRSGESLWIIARRYGTTINAIQAENNLRSTSLHIGQELNIPGTKPPATAKPKEGARTYTVRNGDSPYTIALKHNITLKKFLEINQLHPRSRIFPGQMLYIE